MVFNATFNNISVISWLSALFRILTLICAIVLYFTRCIIHIGPINVDNQNVVRTNIITKQNHLRQNITSKLIN